MFVNFLKQLMGTVVAGIQWILDYIWPSAGVYGVDANLVLGFTIPARNPRIVIELLLPSAD